ncbi:MAG: hypothetical protein ACKKMP_01340 [Candidatus Nealsonbacteria bacterium]
MDKETKALIFCCVVMALFIVLGIRLFPGIWYDFKVYLSFLKQVIK